MWLTTALRSSADIMVGTDDAGTNIEVLKGLSQADQVVINGQNNLRDEMNGEDSR